MCSKVCKSPQQLQLHHLRVHNQVHPLHMAVHDTFCLICLTQFHSRHRLLEHSKYKGKTRHCIAILLERGPIISEAQARARDTAAATSARVLAHSGFRRSYAAKPAHRIPGPLVKLALQNLFEITFQSNTTSVDWISYPVHGF